MDRGRPGKDIVILDAIPFALHSDKIFSVFSWSSRQRGQFGGKLCNHNLE